MSKKLLVVSLVLVMVLSFVACSSGGTSSSSSQSSIATGSSSQTSTKESSEATTNEKVVLQACFYDAGRQTEYDTFFGGFTEKNPGISVETILNGIDYQANLMTMIASNTMPDIIGGEYRGLYNYGSAGHLIELTNEPFISNFPDNIVSQMTAPDGKIYGLATNISAMGIFYNEEMFKKAGIDKFPETISELQIACDKLTTAGFVPFSLAGTESWTLGQMFFVEIASVQPDVITFSNEEAGKPEANILMPEMLTGLKTLDIQFKNAIDTAASNDYGTFINDFASGKVAMIQMGTWALATINGLNPTFTVRYGAPPYTENAGDVRLSANISVSFAIGSQTKYRDECLNLFDYLASDDGQTSFGKLFGEIPVVPGAEFSYIPCTTDIKKYVDSGKICPWSQVLMSEAGRNEGSPIIQSYYFGEISAEEAVKGVYDNWYK